MSSTTHVASNQADLTDEHGEIDALTILGEQLIETILQNRAMEAVEALLESGAPLWYQSMSEGTSPLHAAAYVQNVELVRLLLEKGAVWNSVDYLKLTAGDIALSFDNVEMYNLIRDAGIRTELLLSVLSSRVVDSSPANILLQNVDETAAAVPDDFLQAKLKFTTTDAGQRICLLQIEGEEIGVMMGWEEDIMKTTADLLCSGHPRSRNLKVLNVGFGLGIIDDCFQARLPRPEHHVIIEAHPDVLRYMRELGWYDREGVTILEGRWQDFIGSPELQHHFDIVYTDTFSEDYEALHTFFKKVPSLLAGPDSRFSFFHGLGATNALFYDVYTNVAELNLADVGIHIEWHDVLVSDEDDRWGDSRQYFTVPIYRLPIGTMRM